jgi:hypothetical protein
LITKFTRIYGKKLGSPISTLKGKCWQMVFLPKHWTFSLWYRL